MKIPSEQESKALAETDGWTPEFADGFLDGEYSRKFGAKPSPYGMVGRDDYCLGFRAGYFERKNPAATGVQTRVAPGWAFQSVDLDTPGACALAPAFKLGFAY